MTHVLIVGGGIGGLTTALSLAELGYEIDVFESAPEVKPLGVGINVLPHAVRELHELGLEDALTDSGILTAELAYFSKHGRPIWSEPRGRDAGYRWPQVSIHRGTLHLLLLDAAMERLGKDRIHLGHHFVEATQDADGVTARFSGASGTEPREARGDLLIGADGIHSQLRAQLHPGQGGPRWNGTWLWRGVTVREPFLTGRSMIMAGHAEQKFVCYPIAAAPQGEGKQLINWIAELRRPASELAEREDWNKQGKLEEFLPEFESWRFDWLDVPKLIRDASAVYAYPMVDRDPLDHWGEGRMTLLGDAAHPMYPVGSNGASQAILDARTLTGCLRSLPPVEALRTYERARLPATAAITLANRKQGPEECMTLVEARAPNGFDRTEEVISQAELQAISAKYKRLAGFSIQELNQRPSLADVNY